MKKTKIKEIEEFTTEQIMEGLNQILQYDSIRDNLIELIKCWDSDTQEDLLDYLRREFENDLSKM